MTPFRGFTELYKRAHDKDDSETRHQEIENATKKFTGFVNVDNEELVKKIEGRNETENKKNDHVTQMNYADWFHNRLKTAITRCRNKYGSVYQNEKNIDIEFEKLVRKVNERRRHQMTTNYDIKLNLNPPHEVMERKFVNELPQNYQFNILTGKIEKLLESEKGQFHREKAYNRRGGLSSPTWTYDRTAAKRKELTEYMKEALNLPSNRSITFETEIFSNWYERISFNYDKKFRKLPTVPTDSNENFENWLERVNEIMVRNLDEDSSTNIEEFVEKEKPSTENLILV